MSKMDLSSEILSNITVYMKYSKYLPELKRRETWDELVTRNMEMHIKHYPKIEQEIRENYKFVYNKQVLPSMRSMQFAGKPIEISPNRIYNCAFAPIDDWRVFSEIMFLLLGGTGVGYSVQNHHVDALPEIQKPNKERSRRWLVADSIEGWADAVKVLVKSYFFGGSHIEFDFSDIRAKGARLVTSGGKAPGPQPLKECLIKLEGILDSKENGTKLTPIEVHDMVCHIADAVLAGGIRRAALISLFSATDEEMIGCKSGNWWETNPQRGRANNSAVLMRHKITKEYFMDLWKRIEASGAGEPGIYLSNDKDWGTNPCCFVGDTLVKCADGEKTIAEIVDIVNSNGDCLVETFNEETNEVEYKNVINGLLTKENADVIKLTIEENGVEYTVTSTDDHRFYTKNRGWVEAKDLTEDDDIQIYQNKAGKLIKKEYLEQKMDVYDIEVEDNHNFFANGILAHNCEIALRPFQFCNLTEINVSDVESQEDYEGRVKAASFIGTLQAGYTNFHYLRPIWQRTTEKDALIGISMTGIGSGAVLGLNMKSAAKVVKEENERVAGLLGINKAARTTTVKPAGTTSLTLGTSSGIHAWHNDYYIRRIRVGKNEAIYTYLSENHPELVEDEYFRPHDTAVIGIPQKAPQGSILRNESPIQLLERVKKVQQEWIKPGHRSGNNAHNVSATISVREHEWPAVGEWMWSEKEYYNGLSVLPYSNHTYVQAPFTDCTKEEYEKLMETLKDVDLSKIVELDDDTDLSGELACAGNSCEIK
jgi:hypothetical protein